MKQAYRGLEHRIRMVTELPFASLDSPSLKEPLVQIEEALPTG